MATHTTDPSERRDAEPYVPIALVAKLAQYQARTIERWTTDAAARGIRVYRGDLVCGRQRRCYFHAADAAAICAYLTVARRQGRVLVSGWTVPALRGALLLDRRHARIYADYRGRLRAHKKTIWLQFADG